MNPAAAAVPARPAPSPRLQLLAGLMVLASTVAIASVPTFTKIAFDGGSNTLTVITARSAVSVVLTGALVVLLGQSLRLERGTLLLSLATGAFYAAMMFGFLGAVAYIPVNMAILIYFIHPLLVGVVAARLGDERISGRMLVALVAGLAGLTLAVGLTLEALNPVGVALAVLSALTCVFVIVGNGRAMRRAGSLVVIFYMSLSTAILLTIALIAFGTVALPGTGAGWLGFATVAVGYTFGTLAFFCAMPILGTVRSTMISNIEPLLGIGFAMVILGEQISLVQGLGIALVLAAIVAMELRR